MVVNQFTNWRKESIKKICRKNPSCLIFLPPSSLTLATAYPSPTSDQPFVPSQGSRGPSSPLWEGDRDRRKSDLGHAALLPLQCRFHSISPSVEPPSPPTFTPPFCLPSVLPFLSFSPNRLYLWVLLSFARVFRRLETPVLLAFLFLYFVNKICVLKQAKRSLVAVDAQLAMCLGVFPISSFFRLPFWQLGGRPVKTLFGEPLYPNHLTSEVLDNPIRLLCSLLLRWDYVSKPLVAPNIRCCCCSSHLQECCKVLCFQQLLWCCLL